MVSDTNPHFEDVDAETVDELLEQMVRIRRFEEGVLDEFSEGSVPGFVHLCHGHEASHAGMGVAMQPDDWLAVGGSRLHGQYIVKGVPFDEIMAELFGKATGPNGGKGGSMHLADVDRHLYGHAATIGSGQNPAAGLALAQQMRETGNVVLSTIGDGGTSRGSFHTALVFAAAWNLPVVYIIENNGFAISYSTQQQVGIDSLADYGKPLNIPSYSIDGSDPVAVYETISEAITRAREGGGPTLVESRVTRLRGHFEGDKQAYRTEEEARESNAERDPVTNFQERVIEAGHITAEAYDALVDEIDDEVGAAIQFAKDSPDPAPSTAYEDVLRLPLYGQGEGDA
ncbi:thiamine pyrophosphate-dependent dehydrogenase E1 component subunit alpha [Halorubellus salinus]|uniref:thiamine pyrophosphate-dependent dehydrogenase E1 component subunit alpha n=1 Tax=Halorubellus salinus TaxID=755309 RepID=UPI001D078830|nr:thiamine pyrophosphate-dependent dehydrogenase E1 component subunit alpha [Halorubellus salinus]